MAPALEGHDKMANTRNEAIYSAFASGGYKMKEIGEYFGLHYSSISKIVKEME